MKFRTITDSVYELDLISKRFRRMSGEIAPTPRVGQDGKWKSYMEVSFPVVGRPTWVTWEVVSDNGMIVMKTTATSPVKEVFDFTETDEVVFRSFLKPSC